MIQNILQTIMVTAFSIIIVGGTLLTKDTIKKASVKEKGILDLDKEE